MSRKRLTNAEMLYVTDEWVTPQTPANLAILANTDLAPTLPRIQGAHNELAQAARPSGPNPRLLEITTEQAHIDDRHDDVIRGIYGFFTSTAALLGSADGAQLLVLRDHLIPSGLATLQKTYAAEAGEAAQLAPLLTPQIRAQLDKILVGPKTPPHRLTAYFDEWIQLGQRLGDLEKEKARLLPPESAGLQANLVAARNKWLRTVNLFLAFAEASEIDPDTDHLIFSPLRAIEAKADKRGPQTPETHPDPTPAPQTP